MDQLQDTWTQTKFKMCNFTVPFDLESSGCYHLLLGFVAQLCPAGYALQKFTARDMAARVGASSAIDHPSSEGGFLAKAPAASVGEESANFEKESIALLVVDPYNDFISQGGIASRMLQREITALLDPDSSPRHIEETRRYILDFNVADEGTTTVMGLYEKMLALHPNRVNPGSLWQLRRR